MTIAPQKKAGSTPKIERTSQTSPDSQNDSEQTQKPRSPLEQNSAAAAALALRTKLAKQAGCRVLADSGTPQTNVILHPDKEPSVNVGLSSNDSRSKTDKAKKQKKTVTFASSPSVRNNEAECSTGYNSDDEYGEGFKNEELETAFAQKMKDERGFHIVDMEGDGNCMFRAVAHQIYGDQKWHDEARKLCMDYMAKNKSEFSSFVTEDINDYIERKRKLDIHGNHLELQVMTEIYARPIEIYQYDTIPLRSFTPVHTNESPANANAPIRLSYHGKTHYNAVVDPYTATIGVGLGLPEFKPGEADKKLLTDAIQESESQDIEEAMLKDKLNMSDQERTERELNDAIMRESLQEYIKAHNKRASPQLARDTEKSASSEPTGSTHLSTTICSRKAVHGVKRGASSPNLPGCSRDGFDAALNKARKLVGESMSMPNIDNCDPGPSTSRATKTQSPASSGTGLYEELLSAQCFENDETDLARAIALSNKEYMDSLNSRKAEEMD
ncbi:hypothetical protein QR680_003464 [Steinernema hermaphroditum]|uniref:ubiquitinyl hydrolase 1 n=1 Tax=Steinernema hermaphroditum TaxID=289476 RepID=A0AA39LK73_9BILA|nr:hypothetical protein QR680_003464 [Steinernema hermaphroditum]